jgi:hypothetical protein
MNLIRWMQHMGIANVGMFRVTLDSPPFRERSAAACVPYAKGQFHGQGERRRVVQDETHVLRLGQVPLVAAAIR